MQYNKTIGLPICALLVFSGCSNNANQPSESSQATNPLVLTRDADGYDADGYNPLGLNKDGFDRRGYDARGCDKDGLDFFGMTCTDRKDFADNNVTYQVHTNLQTLLNAEIARAGTCTADLATCVAQRDDRGTKLATAQGQITALEQTVNDKNAELADKNNQLTAKDRELATRHTTIDNLNTTIGQNNRDIAGKDQQIRTLAESKTKLEEDLGGITKRLTDLQKQLQNSQKSVNDREAKLAQNAHISKQLTQELSDLKIHLQEQERKAQQHQQELANAKAEDNLQKVIDQLQPAFEELKRKQKTFLFGDNHQGLTKDTIVSLVKKLLEKPTLSLSSNKAKREKENYSPSASPTKRSIMRKVNFDIPSVPRQLGDNSNQAMPVQEGKPSPGSPGTPADVGAPPSDIYYSDLDGDDEVGDEPPSINYDDLDNQDS